MGVRIEAVFKRADMNGLEIAAIKPNNKLTPKPYGFGVNLYD